MARKDPNQPKGSPEHRISTPVDELLAAALSRGDESLETGRYIVTFKENALEEGLASLGTQSLRVANARDFESQAVTFENVGDADALVFPEIGAAVVTAAAVEERDRKSVV